MSEASTATPAARRDLFEDEHEALRESFRLHLEREVLPAYPEWRQSRVPRDVLREMASHQFVAASVPEEYGGAGIEDFRFGAVVAEEAMRANLTGLALTLVALDAVAIPLLAGLAPEEHRAAWLEGVASGEVVVALAIPEEPLRAARGDGGLALDGAASGVVNGGLAELIVAPVSIGDGEDTALVALEADAEGLTRAPSPALVGPGACDRADLVFDGVEVPGSAILSEDAAAALAGAARAEQLSLAVMAVAGARAALAETLVYVHDRRAFGQPIAEFENTRFALAGVASEIEAVGALVDACVAEHGTGSLSASRCAAAKLQATELFCRAADWGVQLHGGYGYMLEYPISRAFTDARFLRLHGGSSERMKEIVAGSIGL